MSNIVLSVLRRQANYFLGKDVDYNVRPGVVFNRAISSFAQVCGAVIAATILLVLFWTYVDIGPDIVYDGATSLSSNVVGGTTEEVALDYCSDGDRDASMTVQYRYTNGGFSLGEFYDRVHIPDGCGTLTKEIAIKGGLPDGIYAIELVITHKTNYINESTQTVRTQLVNYVSGN